MAYKYYKDEVVPSTGRKYTIDNNDDGTKKITDVTSYTVTGSTFGAADINAICTLECNYEYVSGTHKLTTQNTSSEILKFKATTAHAQGETVTFNGTAMTLKGMDGADITENAWGENSLIIAHKVGNTLYLSSRMWVSGTTLMIRT